MKHHTSPRITAVISTCNRGDRIIRTLQSILRNQHTDFELIVVDQSTDEATRESIAPFLSDPRLRYIREQIKGLGRSRNVGMAAARADVVAFTDDDCEVPPDWLSGIELLFDRYPMIAVVCCAIEAEPYDPSLGWTASYPISESRLATRVIHKCWARGTGAGQAVRRSAIETFGGFDEILGAGALFPSSEDTDIVTRALLKGYHVYEASEITVIHFGYRPHTDGRALAWRNWIGIGAAFAKPLKCGYWSVAWVAAHEFFVFACVPPFHQLLTRGRLGGFTPILAFAVGFYRGLWTPTDCTTIQFRSRHPSEKASL